MRREDSGIGTIAMSPKRRQLPGESKRPSGWPKPRDRFPRNASRGQLRPCDRSPSISSSHGLSAALPSRANPEAGATRSAACRTPRHSAASKHSIVSRVRLFSRDLWGPGLWCQMPCKSPDIQAHARRYSIEGASQIRAALRSPSVVSPRPGPPQPLYGVGNKVVTPSGLPNHQQIQALRASLRSLQKSRTLVSPRRCWCFAVSQVPANAGSRTV